MSVIIKATGVTFSNTNLPILSPMITDGLVGAFRPNSSPLGLLDLSGNGKTLTKQGNPTLTPNSIIVDKNNGFITDMPETMDVTLIAVHRAIKGNGENPWEGFVVGCFYGNRGTSIWNAYYAPTNKITINAQCYGKKLPMESFQTDSGTFGTGQQMITLPILILYSALLWLRQLIIKCLPTCRKSKVRPLELMMQFQMVIV